jgi:hypothetical protein
MSWGVALFLAGDLAFSLALVYGVRWVACKLWRRCVPEQVWREGFIPLGPPRMIAPFDIDAVDRDIGTAEAAMNALNEFTQRASQPVCYGVDLAQDPDITAVQIVRSHQVGGPNYEELVRITRDAFWPNAFGRAHENQKKSLELLKQWLTSTQLEQYKTTGQFHVVGCHTGTRYRITNGRFSFNVLKLKKNGTVRQRLCFVPDGAQAAGDVMLAQKIALEQDERRALKIANKASAYNIL